MPASASSLPRVSLIAGVSAPAQGTPFQVAERTTGKILEPEFYPASSHDVERACAAAWHAYLTYRNISGAERAAFLRAIAEQIEARTEAIVERYQQETALPEARARGELGRTTGQLRLFADIAEEGSWVDARIDHAIPDRKPIPKPDMRSMRRPIGPVAVFGASNFALAFSVAGGDTASALAAGCPVVAKGHPAHPGVSVLVAQAIAAAAEQTGMPAGVFSLLLDSGIEVGQALVKDRRIQAVGFTGSRQGGLALVALAQTRPTPIPVFAEMSSINPSFLLPERLKNDPEGLADTLAGSVTMGVGQFCTNPGLLIAVGDADAFRDALQQRLGGASGGCMLTEGIRNAYRRGTEAWSVQPGVSTLVEPDPNNPLAMPGFYETDAESFVNDPVLHQEVFGPATLLVRARDAEEAMAVAEALEGQLTATFHGTEADLSAHAELVSYLELKAGRLLVNQVPTGLEVCHSTVHGGPFPATSDGRTTSVGARAIERWTRLVCWQNAPQDLLPAELRDDANLARIVDGVLKA